MQSHITKKNILDIDKIGKQDATKLFLKFTLGLNLLIIYIIDHK